MVWVMVVGLMTLGLFLGSVRKPAPGLPRDVGVAVFLAALFILWGLVQGILPVGHFVALGADLAPQTVPDVLSVNPTTTLRTALYFLAHLLFFIGVFIHLRRSGRQATFIRTAGIIVSLYALYGFIVYGLGNGYILWYEKWANEEYLTSTFVNRNSFAAFAGLGLLCLLAHARAVVRDRPIRSARDIIMVFSAQWWLPVSLLLVISSLFLTGSRGGFLSVMAGVVLFAFLSFMDTSGRLFQPRKILAMVVVVALGAGLFSLSGQELGDRLSGQVNVDDRFDIYPLMVDAIADQPVTGYGLGTFEETFRIYRTITIRNKYFMHGHNDYLELAMTAGIPATLVLLAAFAVLASRLWRTRNRCGPDNVYVALALAVMAQIAVHSLVDFPLQIPGVSYFWVALLAAGVAARQKVPTKEMASE